MSEGLKKKGPYISPERLETIRQSIESFIGLRAMSAKEISSSVGIPEKEVYDHLEHIRKSMGRSFRVEQSRCKKCGFEFEKRERLKKPGKCPSCKGESISPPLFSLKKS